MIWKGNLLVIGLLIVIVLGYFFWQVKQVQQTFLHYVQEHSIMLAGVIELNARSAVLSQEIIEEIIHGFMSNTARFIDYLDTVENFSADELAEFSLEAGLAGIRIIRAGGKVIEGPPEWFQTPDPDCLAQPRKLQHLYARHLYFLSWPQMQTPGCIIIGVKAAHIEALHAQVGLPRLLKILSDLSAVQYIEIKKGHAEKKSRKPEVVLLNKKTAEVSLALGKDVLIIGLNTNPLSGRTRQLWNEFLVFSAVLIFLGIFFSWLLQYYQSTYMQKLRVFERELARQREDAALGRATATITHEIKNPLNAISMGLQRLQIEVEQHLNTEYQELVATMLKAVQRTNNIVTGLRRYIGPLKLHQQHIRLDLLINNILSLYHKKCEQVCINVSCEINYKGKISADADMLEQVLENLIKNAIEAQPEGGYLKVGVEQQGLEVAISIENKGLTLSAEQAGCIFEPYFTTKTRGTGLGLTIAKRIITAHQGRIEVQVPHAGLLRMIIYLKRD